MRRAVVALAVLVLVGTACGKDKKNETKASTSTGATSKPSSKAPVTLSGKVNAHDTKDATSGGSVAVEADDFYFNPTFIKGKPGSTLTIELKNEGSSPHTFTSAGLKVDSGTLNPGDKKTVTITVPASGAVEYHCNFHGSQGMRGAVFTKEGDTVSSTGSDSGSTNTTASYNY